MAKTKVRPHPGALAELLNKKDMTQLDAAGVTGIDRKTLAKINRGEDVKLETLQKLAKKLNVAATHFDPPADDSVSRTDTKPDDPRWLSLMLRKLDAVDLAEMLSVTERIVWQLNIHTVDDETVPVLEQLEDAIKDLYGHLFFPGDPEEDGSLRSQLAGLKKHKHVASLLEELAKHRLAILGAEYLVWESNQKPEWHEETEFTNISYISSRYLALSIDAHPAQPRRARVWQGNTPPKVAPNWQTIISVNGMRLDTDEDAEIPFENLTLN